jgi:hypothetical protein
MMRSIQLIKPEVFWNMEYSTSNEDLERQRGKVIASIPSFPKSLNMLRCYEEITLKNKKNISLSFSVSCSENAEFTRPDINTNLGTAPESVRICIIKNMFGQYNRWFCNRGMELKKGKFSLSIPLEPGDSNGSEWCSVYGKTPTFDSESLKGFQECLSSPVSLSVIFGGGNFYGHGVSMTKPYEAKVTLNSLLIK